MEQTPNKPSGTASAADALLQKLKASLSQNEADRLAVEAEAAANADVPTARYSFRVTKRAEYEEKAKIAEKLSAAVDDDVSDEELEALLRKYLLNTADTADTKEESVSAASPDDADAKGAEADIPADAAEADAGTENIAESATDADHADTFAEDGISSDALPLSIDGIDALLDQLEEETASAPQTEESVLPDDAVLSVNDPSCRLTTDEAPFFEELPMQVEDITDISAEAISEEVSEEIADETVEEAEQITEEILEELPDEDEFDAEDIELLFAETSQSEEQPDADLASLLAVPHRSDSDSEEPDSAVSEQAEEAAEEEITEEDIADIADEELFPEEAAAETAAESEDDFSGVTETAETPDDTLLYTDASDTEPQAAAEEAVTADTDADTDAAVRFSVGDGADTETVSMEPEGVDFSFDDLPEDILAEFADSGDAAPENAEPETSAAAEAKEDDKETDAEKALLADAGLFDELLSDVVISGEDSADSVPAKTGSIADDELAAMLDTLTDNADRAQAGSYTADADGDSEPDPTDVDLAIAFGMEDTIGDTADEEKAGKYRKAVGDRKQKHFTEMHARDRSDFAADHHIEYVSSAQNKEIFAEFKKSYGTMFWRMFAAAVLLILLFLLENGSLLGMHFKGVLDRESYPLIYTLIDFQLVVLLGALVQRGVRRGFRAMFCARPIPESITALLLTFSLIYTTVIAALCPMHGLRLYNFPIALTVLFELIYEYMNLRRFIMSFKIISSKRLKYAIDPVSPEDSETERKMFSGYISDDPSLFRIKRSAFIDDYFKRTETYPYTHRILRAIFPAVLILTIVSFCVTLVRSGSVYPALNTAYIALLLTLPSAAFISFGYPMYRASGLAYEKDSAIIGETSLGEYSDASVISFDDKEVFPPHGIHVRSVKVFGNNRIDHVIYAAASVFHVVGGPLADVFETASRELGYATDVQLVRVDPDGIEARIGGDAVLCGKAAFMNRYGYGVSLNESENTMEETGDASILYIAYENNVAAKLYLQYSVEPDFENVLKQLCRQHICVGIKSSDPNIDDHLLSCKIKTSKSPIRIIKCAEPKETAIVVDTLSSGIVSKSSAKSLLQTLAMCSRVLSAARLNNVLKVVSMFLAAAAMIFFLFSGMELTAASVWIALYQLFWVIPITLISRYYI